MSHWLVDLAKKAIQEEFDKGEKIDEDKVMRLRFAQLMRGLYLNQTGINNY